MTKDPKRYRVPVEFVVGVVENQDAVAREVVTRLSEHLADSGFDPGTPSVVGVHVPRNALTYAYEAWYDVSG